jgi:hypothetical protein
MVTEPTLVIECGVSHESGLRRYADDLHAKHESVFLLRINPEAEAVNGNRLLAIRSTAEAALVSLFLGARD